MASPHEAFDKSSFDALSDEEKAYKQFETQLTDKVWLCFEQDFFPRHEPRSQDYRFSYEPGQPIVMIDDVIDQQDVGHLVRLAHCIREQQPESADDKRDFNLNSAGYGGGNNVTYMGQFIQQIIPEFSDHMRKIASVAATHAGWYPHPNHLGIRCAELLQYNPGGELLMHRDEDSIYTLVVMISKPGNDFTGGDFVIMDPKKPKYYNKIISRSKQYSATLFDSNYDHGVDKIHTGERLVFVIEFWHLQDTRVVDLRPHPLPEFKPVLPQRIEVPYELHRSIVCGKSIGGGSCPNPNPNPSLDSSSSGGHSDPSDVSPAEFLLQQQRGLKDRLLPQQPLIQHSRASVLKCKPCNEYLYGGLMFVFGLAVGVFVATLCWGFKIARRNNSGGTTRPRPDTTVRRIGSAQTASAKNRGSKDNMEVDIHTDSLDSNSDVDDGDDGDDDNEHTSGLRKRK